MKNREAYTNAKKKIFFLHFNSLDHRGACIRLIGYLTGTPRNVTKEGIPTRYHQEYAKPCL